MSWHPRHFVFEWTLLFQLENLRVAAKLSKLANKFCARGFQSSRLVIPFLYYFSHDLVIFLWYEIFFCQNGRLFGFFLRLRDLILVLWLKLAVFGLNFFFIWSMQKFHHFFLIVDTAFFCRLTLIFNKIFRSALIIASNMSSSWLSPDLNFENHNWQWVILKLTASLLYTLQVFFGCCSWVIIFIKFIHWKMS